MQRRDKAVKGRKIFVGTDNMGHAAYFGWQDKGQALYGLREGYKNSADDLVSLVISSNCDSKTLDTYIFPIMFLYRHSLEISLKHIYQRCYGELPEGGHDLLTLWFTVKRDVIDKFIISEEFVESAKARKENFTLYSLDGISLSKIQLLFKELQEANQTPAESNPQAKQVDQKAEVWRYLMTKEDKAIEEEKNEQLFFTSDHFIDYIELRNTIDHIYDVLDFIYNIVDDYFSS